MQRQHGKVGLERIQPSGAVNMTAPLNGSEKIPNPNVYKQVLYPRHVKSRDMERLNNFNDKKQLLYGCICMSQRAIYTFFLLFFLCLIKLFLLFVFLLLCIFVALQKYSTIQNQKITLMLHPGMKVGNIR